MRHWIKPLFVALALVLFIKANSFASQNPYNIPTDMDDQLQVAFGALFNLDFDQAKSAIKPLRKHRHDHPMIALAEAVIPWWELTVHVMERDQKGSRAFEQASNRCLDIAAAKLGSAQELEARIAIGTMLGLMSRWSAANRAWLAAYTRGNKSVSHLERALKLSPKAVDAYMTLGTINYARTIINNRLGEKLETTEQQTFSLAVRQLKKAHAEAAYFHYAAGLLLAGILANEKPKDALPLLDQLDEENPSNQFVQTIRITALYNAGRLDDLLQHAQNIRAEIECGVYPKNFLTQALFAESLVTFRRGQWEAAADQFNDAYESGREDNPYTTWAKLYQGYCLDLLGRRQKAKTCYRIVLSRKPRYASHEHAQDRFRRAFDREEVEFKKLEL